MKDKRIFLVGNLEAEMNGKIISTIPSFFLLASELDSVSKRGYKQIVYKLGNGYNLIQTFPSKQKRDQALTDLANGETMIGEH